MFDAEISPKVAMWLGPRHRMKVLYPNSCHYVRRKWTFGPDGPTNDLHQKHSNWRCSSIRNNDRVSRHLDFRAVATSPTSSWCKSRFRFTVSFRPPIVLARHAPCVCTRFLLGVSQGIIVIDNFVVLPTFSPPATLQPSTKRDDWTGWAAHRA